MKTFTRADVLSWQPCHGEIETLRIMEGLPPKMTAVDVLRHEAANPEDRLWCVLRSDVLSERTLRLFAAWCGRGALDAERAAGREPDPRSWHAVDVAERYALGEATEDDLRVASDAAYDAYAACASYACAARAAADAAYDSAADAYDAAYAADDAYDIARAAYAAVRAAASEVAYAAARAADDDDARAADAAAAAAARAAQVERLIQIIEEGEK